MKSGAFQIPPHPYTFSFLHENYNHEPVPQQIAIPHGEIRALGESLGGRLDRIAFA